MRALLVLLYAFFLCSLSCCFCQEELSSFEVDPLAIVASHVDATSGAWREQESDLFVSSRVLFTLHRYYSSAWGDWKFFPHCLLARESTSSGTVILTQENNGTPLRFVKSQSAKSFHCEFHDTFCNTAHGTISRGTNYSNFKCEGDERKISITHPDGTIRTYEKALFSDLGPLCMPLSKEENKEPLQTVTYFRLISEAFPTCANIHYRYDGVGRLASLELIHDPKQAGRQICFSYGNEAIHVSLDGRNMVSYSFNEGKLVHVKRVQKPSVQYTYQNKLLVRKDYPQGRFTAITYDANEKVNAIFGPLSEIPSFTFHYSEGMTEARNARGYTLFFHHVQRRLNTVALHDANGLYRQDRFVWSSDKLVSRLLGHSTHDKDGIALWATTNTYTEDGNISQSKFYSVATEHAEHPIVLDTQGLATGKPESETPTFVYKGPFGLISEQNDGGGNSVEYTYKEGTSLITERLEKAKKDYKRRSFYKYDKETSALVKEVHDYGMTKPERELSGVIDRSILEIQPRKYPKEGLDEEVHIQKWFHKSYLTHVPDSENQVRRLRLLFDTDNNLVRKELYDTNDALAKVEEFAYDEHGNCTRSVNAIGEVVFKTYDENDNCIRIEEYPSGRITSIEYDLNNCPTTTEICYLDGSFVKTSSVYDNFGNKVASLDAYGNCTEYRYDIFSRLISTTYPLVQNEHGTPIRLEETFAYDIFNNVTLKTDPKGFSERYLYTSSGKVLRTDYPDGTHQWFKYDDKAQTIYNRDASFTDYIYDKERRLSSVLTFSKNEETSKNTRHFYQRFTYSSRNVCTEAQQPNGSFVLRNYDSFCRISSEIETTQNAPDRDDKEASKREYEYDSLHRPHRIKRWIDDESFIVECLQYDRLDRIIEHWIEEPDNVKSSHTFTIYDLFGNISETHSNNSQEKFEYIEGTRAHRITHKNGSVTHIAYNEEQYNSLGQRYLEKVITDPAGISTTVKYDALGREVQLTVKDPFGKVLTDRQVFYDACNNLSASLEFKDETTTTRTEWKHGPMQRLEMLSEAVGTDAARTTFYSYNKLGKLTQVSHSNGLVYTYEYNSNGTLAKVLNAKSEVTQTFLINLSGQIEAGKSSENVKTLRKYTAQGRLKEETIEDAWGKYSCYFSYDRLGRLKLACMPDKATIKYHYVGTRQKGVDYKSPSSYYNPDYRHEFTRWDAFGQPTEERLFTGEFKKRSYNEIGALASLTTPFYSETILKRDEFGNPLAIERDSSIAEFSYNSLNQLVEEKTDKKIESYAYDALGNLQKHNGKAFTSNALNQLSSATQPCRYDGQGNLVAKGHFAFTYNDNHQLIEAKDTISGKSTQYQWDVQGRRTSRKADKSVLRFFYIGTSEIGAIDQYGSLVEIKIPERVVDDEAFGAICIQLKNKTYLPITNLFGDIVKLIDPVSKNVVESYEYSGYGQESILKGNIPQEESTAGNPWRYRGLRTDPLTKLVHFTFREYSPELQHFITPDPTGYADGPNLYSYARSNPISYCDLNGLETRRGPCLCHPECEYYTTGVCGHGGGIIIEDELPSQQFTEVKEWFYYEQDMARVRNHRGCSWPVHYSESFELQGEVVPDKGLGFINGIMNSPEEALASATYVSNLAGGKNIQLTYAASNGLPPDLTQAGYNLFGLYATNATKILHDTWIQYFDSAGPDATYLQVCHSWGAIHVRNALLMCKDKVRKRIYILAVAPGGYISEIICRRAIHLINKDPLRDGITRIDQAGLRMAFREGTVQLVESLPNEPFINHSFQSATYMLPMNKSIKKYFEKGEL